MLRRHGKILSSQQLTRIAVVVAYPQSALTSAMSLGSSSELDPTSLIDISAELATGNNIDDRSHMDLQEVSLLPDMSVTMMSTTDISGNGGGGAVLLDRSADSLVGVSVIQFDDDSTIIVTDNNDECDNNDGGKFDGGTSVSASSDVDAMVSPLKLQREGVISRSSITPMTPIANIDSSLCDISYNDDGSAIIDEEEEEEEEVVGGGGMLPTRGIAFGMRGGRVPVSLHAFVERSMNGTDDDDAVEARTDGPFLSSPRATAGIDEDSIDRLDFNAAAYIRALKQSSIQKSRSASTSSSTRHHQGGAPFTDPVMREVTDRFNSVYWRRRLQYRSMGSVLNSLDFKIYALRSSLLWSPGPSKAITITSHITAVSKHLMSFVAVFIPCDPAEAMREDLFSKEGGLAADTLRLHVDAYFCSRGGGSNSLVTDIGAEIIVVSLPCAENDFIGVSLYCGRDAQSSGQPVNARATSLLTLCGHKPAVHGDAYMGRYLDDERIEWDRMDLRLSDLSSDAEWVRRTQAQNRGKSLSGMSTSGTLQNMFNQQQQQQMLQQQQRSEQEAASATSSKASESKNVSWSETADESLIVSVCGEIISPALLRYSSVEDPGIVVDTAVCRPGGVQLRHTVDSSCCTWTLDKGRLLISLSKKEEGLKWGTLSLSA